MSKIFEDENSLFQKRINNIVTKGTDKSAIDSLIIAQLGYRNDDNSKKLVELYNYLGLDSFCDVLTIFDDCIICFPSMLNVSEIIQSAAIYHNQASTEKDVVLNINELENMSPTRISNNLSKLKDINKSI